MSCDENDFLYKTGFTCSMSMYVAQNIHSCRYDQVVKNGVRYTVVGGAKHIARFVTISTVHGRVGRVHS